MLNHPTFNQLYALRLDGMAKAFEEQLQMSDIENLSFEDRLGFLIDREVTVRNDRRLKTRLRQAQLRPGGRMHRRHRLSYAPRHRQESISFARLMRLDPSPQKRLDHRADGSR